MDRGGVLEWSVSTTSFAVSSSPLMAWLYVLSVFLHVLAAMFWIGGMMFLGLVVVPVLRGHPERARLVEQLGRVFERAGVVALGVLLVTGIANLAFRGVTTLEQLWATPIGRMGLLKLALFGIVVAMGLWHNRVVGRQAVQLLQRAPRSDEAERLRRLSSWVGRWMLLASVLLALVGVLIARGVWVW
jgi:putative copper export protein